MELSKKFGHIQNKKLGWFPKISLEDGLIQSIKEFRSIKSIKLDTNF